MSTEPTERGKQEIDFFHELYGLQHLNRKPLHKYLSSYDAAAAAAQYLRIEKGQKVM